MRFDRVGSEEDLFRLTAGIGFLPFFKNEIPGWSLEENTAPAVWFTSNEGPWEWKGRLCRDRRLVYGKFFRGRAAFVSLTCFPDLCNWRRMGYDAEGYRDDGLMRHADGLILDALEKHGPSKGAFLKNTSGVRKGFDGAVVRLQMLTFMIPRDFVYDLDRSGRPYGWGKALYDTPERHLGDGVVGASSRFSPRESLERMVRWLRGWMPDVGEEALRKALK